LEAARDEAADDRTIQLDLADPAGPLDLLHEGVETHFDSLIVCSVVIPDT
jgi:hypothetical protein